jgi:hypothetical protein
MESCDELIIHTKFTKHQLTQSGLVQLKNYDWTDVSITFDIPCVQARDNSHS